MLITEDGTGKIDSESYASVAETDTYWEKHGYASSWRDALTEKKEEALRMGTQWLDLEFSTRWDGERVKETQALAWPRSGIEDSDGFAVDDNVIPARLKDATAEVAMRYLSDSTQLMPDVKAADGSILSQSITVGPISESTTYSGAKQTQVLFRKVQALLREFVSSGNLLERA